MACKTLQGLSFGYAPEWDTYSHTKGFVFVLDGELGPIEDAIYKRILWQANLMYYPMTAAKMVELHKEKWVPLTYAEACARLGVETLLKER